MRKKLIFLLTTNNSYDIIIKIKKYLGGEENDEIYF